MKGLPLHSLSEDLCPVDPAHAEKPAATIGDVDAKLARWTWKQELERYAERFSFERDYYCLPHQMLAGFSFDDLCKLRYSSSIMMDRSIEDLFGRVPRYEVVRKIESSMWRWGNCARDWNEVVEAHSCLRRFTMPGYPDFEARLDYTSGYNERGYSKYSRTYLDGVFALLLHYRGKHALTIGFSITNGRRLLVQQVQSAQKTGNRGLYKLPENRLEFAVGLMQANFPGYEIFVVDGASLAKKIIANYETQLRGEKEWCASQERGLTGKTPELYRQSLERGRERCALLAEKISHLKSDEPRLKSLYRNVGRFRLRDSELAINGLLHRQVAA